MVMWLVPAGLGSFFAHRRTLAVERQLGTRALPPHEQHLLWYAGAASLWLVAAVLALVGLGSRRWTRMGRNAAYIFVVHITFLVIFVVLLAPDADAPRERALLSIVTMACVMAGAGLTAAIVCTFIWAGARSERLARLPHTGPPPGPEQYAIYFVSLPFWPAGLIAAAVYNKPQNVQTGAMALRVSLVSLWTIAAAICAAIPMLVGLYV